MTYKRFPSRTHVAVRSGARYAVAEGLELEVREAVSGT
jgi:hypothetical protein